MTWASTQRSSLAPGTRDPREQGGSAWHFYGQALEAKASFFLSSIHQGSHRGHPVARGRGRKPHRATEGCQYRTGGAENTVVAVFEKRQLPHLPGVALRMRQPCRVLGSCPAHGECSENNSYGCFWLLTKWPLLFTSATEPHGPSPTNGLEVSWSRTTDRGIHRHVASPHRWDTRRVTQSHLQVHTVPPTQGSGLPVAGRP